MRFNASTLCVLSACGLALSCASGSGAPPTRLEPVQAPSAPPAAPDKNPVSPRLPAPAPDAAKVCSADADCRLIDDYCEGCNCRALPRGAELARCSGRSVACFAAPCLAQRAVCRNGACALSGGPGGSRM